MLSSQEKKHKRKVFDAVIHVLFENNRSSCLQKALFSVVFPVVTSLLEQKLKELHSNCLDRYERTGRLHHNGVLYCVVKSYTILKD